MQAKKANFVATDMSGLGSKRSKNREKFSFNISDYELNLMSKKQTIFHFLLKLGILMRGGMERRMSENGHY